MKEKYKLFPCVVITTKVENLNDNNGKWWEKNFYLPNRCQNLFTGSSRVQLYLLDQALFLQYEKFVRVKRKIAEAIASDQDLKNAPIVIILDKELVRLYRENTSNEFMDAELSVVFLDLAPQTLEIHDKDIFNSFCVFQPDPVFPENIGEIIFAEPFFSEN